MDRPDDGCLEQGHDSTPMDDRPEVQQCARCRCVYQDSGRTLTLSIGDRYMAVPNAACVDVP